MRRKTKVKPGSQLDVDGQLAPLILPPKKKETGFFMVTRSHIGMSGEKHGGVMVESPCAKEARERWNWTELASKPAQEARAVLAYEKFVGYHKTTALVRHPSMKFNEGGCDQRIRGKHDILYDLVFPTLEKKVWGHIEYPTVERMRDGS